MFTRKASCLLGAGLVGLCLTAASAGANAKPRMGEVTVTATDPALQRKVSYADLNLAVKSGRRALHYRISYTARDLCLDINGWDDGTCQKFAINSTVDQVKLAIARAERQMAGLAVGPPIAISMVIAIR